ncbi:Resistance to Phytophthora parasitica 1, Usually multiple acids move in and out Transporters 36 [Hibiscus trionum]|uniref:WAT1-related protein n=1 Tax=Hibiscus trionum TaxID=183268 RepID=A0A9W7LN93_HIBTR|nr:Resistance to Phytophthora parasitica 1, Usually multiple acids move in and out Transporters 36 [Hibiscus trionum]
MVVMTRERVGEMAPFTVMVIMEACTIALTILAKTAMTAGMSPFVFVVYANAVGSLLLLPFSFLFHRERTDQSLFSFPLLVRVFFLGLTGIALSQNLAFVGLSYSSPIVVCATGLLIPSISFLLSIVLRTKKPDLSGTGSRAKVIGTLVSIVGAIVVELYKGPFIRKSFFFYGNHYQLKHVPKLFVFYSAPDRWILGGVLLMAASLSVSLWNIIQLGTAKLYPQVMKVAAFYSLVGTIQCLVLALCMERDLNAWKLKHKSELLLVVLTGVFGSIIRSNVHLACTRMKGPFYVPMFKPFGIVFATVFGVSFFTNSLHYGSVIGTIIIGVGYYTVMWGQIKEEQLGKEYDIEKMTPLLLEKEEAQVEEHHNNC